MTEGERDNVNSAPPRRIDWKVALGLLVSAVSLYFAVHSLEPAKVWEAFSRAHYVWIIPAVALYLLALVFRTVRWQALLSSERRIPTRELLPTMAMGRGANNIYPFRAGEIVRVLLLRQRNGVAGAAGLASILVERVFDGLTMILFLIAAALVGGIPEAREISIGGELTMVDIPLLFWLAVGVFGVALAVVYAVVLWPGPIRRLAEWSINRFVPRRFCGPLLGATERFVGGFGSIRSASTLTSVLFFSVAVWAAETLSYRLLMNAFGFGVGLRHLLLMSGAANLATALPSGPGNVGTFDAPSIFVLTSVGIAENTAISYQFLLHAVLWSTETFAGLFYMWRVGLKRADLERTLEQKEGPLSG